MKITFFSNFLNHHQIPVSNEFYRLLKDNYTFVACEKVPEERIQLGYHHDFANHPYYLEVRDDASYQKALSLGLESDVVIIGSANDIFIQERIKQKKLTFRYSERLFKTNKHILFYPLILIKRFHSDILLRKKNVYMLSTSAFTPLDYSLLISYPNKFYKWGYFPEYKKQDLDKLFKIKKHPELHFLWVGRMISWKRPLIAIKVIQKLIDSGYPCKLRFIGKGPLESKLKSYVQKRILSNSIEFLGSMKPDQVRNHMESSNIFLFTSTKEEGWGAVLNEAMNSGLATYSYYRIGAAPYLIQHGINGKLFTSKKNLIQELLKDIQSQKQIEMLGRNAYVTISKEWNEKIAVERFLEFSNSILLKTDLKSYPSGPLSKASIITGQKVKRKLF